MIENTRKLALKISFNAVATYCDEYSVVLKRQQFPCFWQYPRLLELPALLYSATYPTFKSVLLPSFRFKFAKQKSFSIPKLR